MSAPVRSGLDPQTLDKATLDRIDTLALHAPDTVQGVAALLDLPEPEAADFLSKNAQRIDAKVLKLSLQGELLEPKARRLAEKLIDRMTEEVGSMDLLEAMDFMKHVLRVIELSDRARQREPEQTQLPVFNFTFTNGIRAERVDVPVTNRAPRLDISDAIEVPAVATAQAAPGSGASALNYVLRGGK